MRCFTNENLLITNRYLILRSLGCVLYELKFLTRAYPRGQRVNPDIPSGVSSCGIFSTILSKYLNLLVFLFIKR